jgi:nitronate monooxygenase
MGGVAGPELVAAVSNAGGLGILAALNLKPDAVRKAIARVRELTDRPFGVNIWLHADVRYPPDVSDHADLVRSVQSVLNELRPRFELPATLEAPRPAPDLVDAALDVMIEERIPVFSAGLGIPEPELVERFHSVDAAVVTMVATVDDARSAVECGSDVVVAQGLEAGGHRSHGHKLPAVPGTGTFALVPQIIEAIEDSVPVVAAGGIVDGRGLAAATMLGAAGVLMGTRFVATAESQASRLWKQRLISRTGATVLTDGFTGQWARVLRSEFTDHWADHGGEPLPGLLQAAARADLQRAAVAADDDQMQPLYAGAAFDLLNDLPSAGDVVTRVVTEAEQLLERY